MKNIYAIILFLFLVNSTFSQELGYVEGEVIVKFHSKYVDKAAVDDEALKEGKLFRFLTYDGIKKLETSLPQYPNIENWICKKIFFNHKTSDTISITRQGKQIRMPKFWSVFIIEFPKELSTINVISELGKIGSPVIYSQANYSDYVEFDVPDIPDDSEYGSQHSLNPVLYPNADINVEKAWNIESGEKFIKVGVHDSGIDTLHPDIQIIDGQGCFHYYDLWGVDARGHGTSVAGIIGAKRNNGEGIAGVAGGNGTDEEGVSLVDFTNGQEGIYDVRVVYIAKGIVDAARKVGDYYQWNGIYTQENHNSNYTGGHGINIGNHSYGIKIKPLEKKEENEKSNDGSVDYDYDYNTDDPCPLCKEAMLFSYRSGVTNVVASGNSRLTENDDHINPAIFPQNMPYNWILKVGASSRNGDLVTYLNNAPSEFNYGSYWGDGLDVIAPGTRDLVYTTRKISENPDTIYRPFNGTSAAAPHVTGAAGLLMSYYNKPCYSNRNLSPDDIEYILTRTATQVNSTQPHDSTGWGRLNVYEALQMIRLPQNQIIHIDSVISSNIVLRDTIKVFVRNAITDGNSGNSQGPYGDDFPTNFEINKEYLLERVKVEQVLDYSEYMQSNTELIDFWVNRSACNSLDSLHDIDSILVVGPGGTNYELVQDVFDVNPSAEISNVANNQFTISGYFYRLIEGYLLGDDNETLPINYWYPANPNSAHLEVSMLIRDTIHPYEFDFPCFDERPFTDTTMNAEMFDLENTLFVYPNPTDGIFNVEYLSSNNSKIVVSNKLGQLIFSKDIKSHNLRIKEEIDLSGYSNGLYYISIIQGDKKIVKKIVKQ